MLTVLRGLQFSTKRSLRYVSTVLSSSVDVLSEDYKVLLFIPY